MNGLRDLSVVILGELLGRRCGDCDGSPNSYNSSCRQRGTGCEFDPQAHV